MKASGWISVEERLPEDQINVMAWVEYPYDSAGKYVIGRHSRINNRWYGDDGDPAPRTFTHWQLLPAPPRPAGEEEESDGE